MAEQSLDILAVADLHYASTPDRRSPIQKREGWLGGVFIRKALLRLRHEGVKPDVILLLGDMLESPDAGDLDELAREARATGARIIAIPGNHDFAPDLYRAQFGAPSGLHEIGGYGFVAFCDETGEGDVTTRSEADLELPERIAAQHPALPLIALQHNPVFPDIEGDYPFVLSNAHDVRRSYAEAGVLLSLSGHYHSGQELSQLDGVAYHTVGAAGQSPFCFSLIRLRGRQIHAKPMLLHMEIDGLWDCHCHTQYAYCATTSQAPLSLELSKAMGMGGVCYTEHAFHLYFPDAYAWSYAWQADSDAAHRIERGDRSRMDEFRSFAESLKRDARGIDVRVGLEVDLLADEDLLLASRDRGCWDHLVGAIHNIHDVSQDDSPKVVETKYMRDLERLLSHPIDVLAHPFRWFRRTKRDIPRHLYAQVARMLQQSGVAAEVNYHSNTPDPEFFSECLARGVRLSLGSDAHEIEEAGEFHPHIRLLKELGVAPEQFGDVLYRPA